MINWEWFAIVPGLILFLYGIENFSREIQKAAGEKFRVFLSKLTKNRFGGASLGAFVTAIIQSSTATTVIAVGLVNAGVISFQQSLGIMIGANVGTTITAQLIAFKLTAFAPFFILLGFLLSIFGGRYKFLGKPLFYFGLVFFSITLLSSAIEPLKDDPAVIDTFSKLDSVSLAILAGLIFTVIIQSSSVTTGIVILLAQNGLLSLEMSIPIIFGTNIGTTVTSALASLRMSLHAKRAAVAHILFNIGGVVIFLPFLVPFTGMIHDLGGTTAHQVANAHTVFNIVCAVIFLLFIKQFKEIVERIIPGKEEEILLHTKYLPEKMPRNKEKSFRLVEKEIKHSLDVTASMFEGAMKTIRTGKDEFQRVEKYESLTDFLNERIDGAILQLSQRKLDEDNARRTVLLTRISNAIEQLADSGEDLGRLSNNMAESGLYLSPQSVKELDDVYQKFMENIKILEESLPSIPEKSVRKIRKNDDTIRELTNVSYKDHIKRLSKQKAYAGNIFIDSLSILETANSKVREIRKLSELYRKL